MANSIIKADNKHPYTRQVKRNKTYTISTTLDCAVLIVGKAASLAILTIVGLTGGEAVLVDFGQTGHISLASENAPLSFKMSAYCDGTAFIVHTADSGYYVLNSD